MFKINKMKSSKFNNILKGFNELNSAQFRTIQEYIQSIVSQKIVSSELETPIEELVCPYCKSDKFHRWGVRNDLQRYRCKKCEKTFNSLTLTPLARLRKKGRWLNYSNCLKEGLTVRNAAKRCGVHKNTAFRWRHRFLKNTRNIKTEKLNGIVEVEELFFYKSKKGQKDLNRKARKHGVKINSKSPNKTKVFVVVGRDRNTNTYDNIVEKVTSETISNSFGSIISKDALFCSDLKEFYRKFTKANNFRHGYIHINKGEFVKKDIVHIKNVDLYIKTLKNWILDHFKGVATKYLNNYVSWFRVLDEFGSQISPRTILLRAKSGGKYKYQP